VEECLHKGDILTSPKKNELFSRLLRPNSASATSTVTLTKSRPGCPPHLPSREKNQEQRASLGLAPPVCVPLPSIERGLTSHSVRAIEGVAELLIFHPVDTIAKRLMSNKAKVYDFLPFVSISMI
jgi:hypothetical protein